MIEGIPNTFMTKSGRNCIPIHITISIPFSAMYGCRNTLIQANHEVRSYCLSQNYLSTIQFTVPLLTQQSTPSITAPLLLTPSIHSVFHALTMYSPHAEDKHGQSFLLQTKPTSLSIHHLPLTHNLSSTPHDRRQTMLINVQVMLRGDGEGCMIMMIYRHKENAEHNNLAILSEVGGRTDL